MMLPTIYEVMHIEKGTLSLISQARGVQVPDTQEQEDWLRSL